MYEAVALKIGKSKGKEFHDAMKKKLGSWYRPRRRFDRLLKFTHKTHYAALNLGSGGPDYGEFCVKFGPSTPLEFTTCFAGDPLRLIFDDDGNELRYESYSPDEITQRIDELFGAKMTYDDIEAEYVVDEEAEAARMARLEEIRAATQPAFDP